MPEQYWLVWFSRNTWAQPYKTGITGATEQYFGRVVVVRDEASMERQDRFTWLGAVWGRPYWNFDPFWVSRPIHGRPLLTVRQGHLYPECADNRAHPVGLLESIEQDIKNLD